MILEKHKERGEIQMGNIVIEKLDHDVPENAFDCGNASINLQIQQSYFPTLLQHAYAFQVSLSDQIVGYYMIKFKTINLENAPEEVGEYSSSLINDCSALHISYIAVDERYQKKEIGTNILKVIVLQALNLCKKFPITIITLNALKDKYQWYRNNGFVAFDESDLEKEQVTIPMYMSCILDKNAIENYCSV